MIYGSTFTGIGGFDLALNRAGMEAAWMCENDRAASGVLGYHFPNIRNLGDIHAVNRQTAAEPIDLLVGGFPCQDVSVAGRRAGLDGKRSGLWFQFIRLTSELSPRWVLIENVPGLLSSNGGRDFTVILRGLVFRGYRVAWRIFDSQYFGVPQRRRRVFIVGHLGSGAAAKVLFESEGLSWNPPARRNQEDRIAGTLDEKSSSGRRGSQANERDFLIYNLHQNDDGRKDRPDGGLYVTETDQALTLQTGEAKGKTLVAFSHVDNLRDAGDLAPTLRSMGFDGSHSNGGSQVAIAFSPGSSSDSYGIGLGDKTPPLRSESGGNSLPVVWQNKQQDGEIRLQEDETTPALTRQWGTGGNNVPFVGVRRLTPVECERLQGFPDGWTAVNGQKDSARYRQLGNAVTVPVVEWIARRIMQYNQT